MLGIIYRVYNKISKKSYIGQTTISLEIRKKQHIKTTKDNYDYKFARALRKYSEDAWEWSVLAEVEIEKLDEYERFFIKDLDTFKNGYNSTKGGNLFGEGNPNYNPKKYKLYHPDYGIIEKTISELCKININFRLHFSELLLGNRNHIKGFVLAENKDKYNELLKIFEFYHPNHGIVKGTPKQISDQYPDYFKSSDTLTRLTRKKNPSKITKGWTLAKYKNIYDELIKKDKSGIITLQHDKYGIITNTRNYFINVYGFSSADLSKLNTGNINSIKGWRIYKQE